MSLMLHTTKMAVLKLSSRRPLIPTCAHANGGGSSRKAAAMTARRLLLLQMESQAQQRPARTLRQHGAVAAVPWVHVIDGVAARMKAHPLQLPLVQSRLQREAGQAPLWRAFRPCHLLLVVVD